MNTEDPENFSAPSLSSTPPRPVPASSEPAAPSLDQGEEYGTHPDQTAVWGAPVPPHVGQQRRMRGKFAAAILVAALVGGGVGGFVHWATGLDSGVSTSVAASAHAASAVSGDTSGMVASVAAKALPSVVSISVQSGNRGGENGLGTGFVYDREGHILTNNHVVAPAEDGGTISVTLSNGKKLGAEIVGKAQGYDVAVLKLKNAPSDLVPLRMGNSDSVAVGDPAIAIGSPFGLSQTVTAGIISAKNRPVAPSSGAGQSSYMNALQTDAPINPGNSGGPLLDAHGAVIGINSAIESPGNLTGQAGSVGLGFAIPVSQANTVAQQLIKTGEPVYPVIGAAVDDSRDGIGAVLANGGTDSAPAITPDGPAAKVGLHVGDVITRFDNRVVTSGPSLISAIWACQPGETVPLTYERDGKETTVQITLGERKGDRH